LKYSNQGDDYIREALQDLKESYAAGKLTWKKRLLHQEYYRGLRGASHTAYLLVYHRREAWSIGLTFFCLSHGIVL
jgi:hypothetical protein